MPLWTMHDGRVRRAELVGVVVVHKETRRCRHATRDGRRHEAIASVVQVHARRGGHATGTVGSEAACKCRDRLDELFVLERERGTGEAMSDE